MVIKKSKSPEKYLFLVRHAHRDNTVRSKDNGLTEKGRRQARALLKYIALTEDIAALDFVSSPKVRCYETIEPIARAAGSRIKTSAHLQERQKQENTAQFNGRLQKFISWWQATPSTHVLACSHGDVLPALAQMLVGGKLEFKKGSIAAIALTKNGPVLRYLLRPSDIF